jgi:3-isopropylmalate/(R)-2-methylmalate dehydratase large subunit
MTNDTAHTLFDKVWAAHVVAELGGGVSLLAIDRHLLHDLEGGPGFTRLAKLGHHVHDPELTFATPDHSIATDPLRTTDSNAMSGISACETDLERNPFRLIHIRRT